MPAQSPIPTPGREDEALSRARTKTPAFSSMASIRKKLITSSPDGTTATEPMTPMTASPSEPPDSISFRLSDADVRQAQDEDSGEDVGTHNDAEWRVRALFLGEKSTGRPHRRAHSFQEDETMVPTLPSRAPLGSCHAESESSMRSSSDMRKPSRRRKSRSSGFMQSRNSKSMDSDEWPTEFGVPERRRTSSTSLVNIVSPEAPNKTSHDDTPITSSSSDCSADVSPTRQNNCRRKSSSRVMSPVPDAEVTGIAAWLQKARLVRLRTNKLMFVLFFVGFLSLGFTIITNRAVIRVEQVDVKEDLQDAMKRYEQLNDTPRVRSKNPPAGGLRGSLVKKVSRNRHKNDHRHDDHDKDEKKDVKKNPEDGKKNDEKPKDKKAAQIKEAEKPEAKPKQATDSSKTKVAVSAPVKKLKIKQSFNSVDPKMFDPDAKSMSESTRVLYLHDSIIEKSGIVSRHVKIYPSDFTDNTQLYGVLDSDDERLSKMELREPYSDEHCVPMQEWQTTFHPSCNAMHELALDHMGDDVDNEFHLFGTKGFWRNAWKVDVLGDHHRSSERETVVLKTLKFEHKFEDAHFEHDRIDAVAMERLTSSPHVINVFGFCGHSVITEFAEGTRLGSLADKSKKIRLERLKIARDIANGLADVHGIDGDGNATFVHLDINPANVVSIGGTLKLNDFNIGIIRRWNVTSQQPCGFPAQYPNAQWRSPEEARNEQNLTEKVDVFSMGHIFFRLICGHEPWNKLEPAGRLIKEEVNEKVKKGILPTIPEEVMKSTDEEVVAIRDAMLSCYTFDPAKRPSAREISNKLQSVLDRLSASQ